MNWYQQNIKESLKKKTLLTLVCKKEQKIHPCIIVSVKKLFSLRVFIQRNCLFEGQG